MKGDAENLLALPSLPHTAAGIGEPPLSLLGRLENAAQHRIARSSLVHPFKEQGGSPAVGEDGFEGAVHLRSYPNFITLPHTPSRDI